MKTTGQNMELCDRLGRVILEAVKREPATATQRWQALVRMGQIAEAYRFIDDETRETIFGSVDNLLQQDSDYDPVRDVLIGDRAH